jgi:hypothetical protein
MTHPKQAIIEKKMEFWQGLKNGQRVQNCCFKHMIGTITEIVVQEAGQNVFGQCVVQWDDGTKTVEHPEH